jgi:hypothetical protein
MISCSTVGKYVRRFVFSKEEMGTPIIPELESDFSINDCITLVLSEGLCLSVRQIAKKVMMSKSTVDRHFTPTMRSKLQHLKRAAHLRNLINFCRQLIRFSVH